jgi:hypothetical protein
MTVLLLVWIGLSALVGYLGRDRKFGFWGYFAISLLLSWVIGLLCVFASDRRATSAGDPVAAPLAPAA